MDCRCVAAITQASVSGLFSITESAFPATTRALPDEHRYVLEEPKQPENAFCPELRPIWTSHYFADTAPNGGLGMDPGTAASVSAAYGTMVYLVSVAGGWLADRILGSYRAALRGGILIACGHYAMPVPTATMTRAGLGRGGDAYEMAAWWIAGSYLLPGLGDVLLETSGMSASTRLAARAFAGRTTALLAAAHDAPRPLSTPSTEAGPEGPGVTSEAIGG